MHSDALLARFPFRSPSRQCGRGRGGCLAAEASPEGGVGASYAFTLVEMLVVIAITVILFALLLRPLVESLRLTQSAQVQAAAQDSARVTMERITRELGSAVYVYDNNSHPFTLPAGATLTAGTRYDRFTNFLNLGVTKSDGTIAVEHAYNAKLDIVPARHSNGTSGLTDPTAGNEPIQPKSGKVGSATLSSTGLLFPLAPGSYITRYWVGLKNPTLPYTNSNEGLLAAASTNGDNTYILYVAQVLPYKTTTTAGVTTTSANPDLFKAAADGKTPELDDPDFFRYVTASDVDWLSPGHTNFDGTGAETVAAHNARVDNWYKIAKPVITAPDIDLLLLPHNPDGSIAYDPTGGTLPTVAHSGASYDPVADAGAAKPLPIVNTSVTFAPATIQGDAAPGTTADYSSLGIPANAADNGGLPYVPTVYTASNQSLVNPPIITLYPNVGNASTANVPYYTTDLYSGASSTKMGAIVNSGDLVEYYHTGANDTTGTAVFDVTTGVVIKDGSYVPMAVNADAGTINFDTPAFPAPPDQNSGLTYDPYSRFWEASPADLNSGNLLACQGASSSANGTPGIIDLTQLFCSLTTSGGNHYVLSETGAGGGSNTSPLSVLGLTTGTTTPMSTPGPRATANAFVVPGSVRVYGPDATPGPNLGSRVLYTPVSPGTPLDYNEYRVDYLNSLLYFYVDASHQLPTAPPATGTLANVQISFDYQANLAPTTAGTAISATNAAGPMLVKVDYQTRDLLDVNIGVRIYDSSQGRSIILPVHNRVQIGDSNR